MTGPHGRPARAGVVRLRRRDVKRADEAAGGGAHGEQDPQVGRGQLLPEPGQGGWQGGGPGVGGVARVELGRTGPAGCGSARRRTRWRRSSRPCRWVPAATQKAGRGLLFGSESLGQRTAGCWRPPGAGCCSGRRRRGRRRPGSSPLRTAAAPKDAGVAQGEVGRAVPAGGVAGRAPLVGVVADPVAGAARRCGRP